MVRVGQLQKCLVQRIPLRGGPFSCLWRVVLADLFTVESRNSLRWNPAPSQAFRANVATSCHLDRYILLTASQSRAAFI